MPHFGTPDEAPSPVLGGEVIERAPETAKLVFIGGTGRSGTHVLSQLVSRHNRYALVPVEVRFHTDADGFPGPALRRGDRRAVHASRMRGFWWKGFQTSRFRGMYRFVDRERYDAALATFEAGHGDDLVAACRRLFYDLLWFRVEEEAAGGGPGRAEHRHRRPGRDPGPGLPGGAGSSTSSATAATPRPRG